MLVIWADEAMEDPNPTTDTEEVMEVPNQATWTPPVAPRRSLRERMPTPYLSSLPILAVVYRFFYLPTANLPIYHNLPISTDFFADLPNFNFFYRNLFCDTECSSILFVISCKLCSHKCYFHVLMVKSASPYNKYYL